MHNCRSWPVCRSNRKDITPESAGKTHLTPILGPASKYKKESDAGVILFA